MALSEFIFMGWRVFIGAVLLVVLMSISGASASCVHCNDGICAEGEVYSCPWDCGYICGDGYCETKPPFSEWVGCPQDCPINNTLLISGLRSYYRPVVSGLQITTPEDGYCTLGAVFFINGTYYGLSAHHCSVDNYTIESPISGNISYVIGEVVEYNVTADMELVRLSVNGSSVDFLNNTVDCIGSNEDFGLTDFIYKIGRTTGLTFGNAVNVTGSGFGVVGINGSIFCDYGDSGSAYILIGKPRKLMGFNHYFIYNFTECWSRVSPDMIPGVFSSVSLPICERGIYLGNNWTDVSYVPPSGICEILDDAGQGTGGFLTGITDPIVNLILLIGFAVGIIMIVGGMSASIRHGFRLR